MTHTAGVPGGVAWLGILIIAGVFALVLGVIPIILFWIIFRKAGLPEPLSLLVLVPGVGPLIPPLILAIADWPALQEQEENRAEKGPRESDRRAESGEGSELE
jgi:hypothetical protein